MELKFRAWDKHRGENGLMLCNHSFHSIAETGLHNQEDLIWMAYTGFKDCNGVEIYEDDILYSEGWNTSCYRVKFVNGSFSFVDLKTEEWVCILAWATSKIEVGVAGEVVGNIHSPIYDEEVYED